MLLRRRAAALRLASSPSRLVLSHTSWLSHRRHYAAVEDLTVRRTSGRDQPDARAEPSQASGLIRSYLSRGSISNEDRTKLLSNVESDSSGVWFGSPSAPTNFYFEHLAVRDMCQCSKCVDQSTKQRHFAFADIPPNIQGQYHTRGNKVIVRWTNDVPGFEEDHQSVFLLTDLFNERNRIARAANHHNDFRRRLWKNSTLKAHRSKLEFSYHDFLNQTNTQSQAVRELLSWGLIFIKEVPPETTSVETLIRRLGPIRNTFYGETWDVRSVAGAKNVAYTARDLGFHQDLLYMANPPGLQALHMIKASSSGGESLFTDGARAVDDLLQNAPEHRQSLFNFLVTYRYRNAGEWYEYTRPTLEGYALHKGSPTKDGEWKHFQGYGDSYDYINWSPPFQGPFARNRGRESRPRPNDSPSKLHQYRNAAEALRQRFEDPEAVYETRMEPGTCVIFNNRRILHARKAFPVDGEGNGATEERWLRGAYADLDPLMSRYRMAKPRVNNATLPF